MTKKVLFLIILTNICFLNIISGCNIKRLIPDRVTAGDSVYIKIVADFAGCGEFNRAGIINPVNFDTLYFDNLYMNNDTLATAFIVIPDDLPDSEIEFFICDTYYWNNRLGSTLKAGTTVSHYMPDLCMVTVGPLNKNQVIWSPPSVEGIDSVIIYKESFTINEFQRIGAVKADLYYFTDTLSVPAQNSDRYRIKMKDEYGVVTLESDIHKTIHLAINAGLGGVWNLSWDNYEGFQYSSYKLFRGTSDGNLAEIAERPRNTHTYTDLNPPATTTYYQVQVTNPDPCSVPGFKSTNLDFISTRSNMVNYKVPTGLSNNEQETGIRILPNPVNSKLLVKLDELDERGAELRILSLDGKVLLIRHLDEPDCEIDVHFLPEGIYIIHLQTSNIILTQQMVKRHN